MPLIRQKHATSLNHADLINNHLCHPNADQSTSSKVYRKPHRPT